MKFVVIDYLKGNLKSVYKGIELVGGHCVVSSDPAEILNADALILPGVGSFTDAMSTMNELGQTDAIRCKIDEGVPFFGICLGLQLLFENGSEGAGEQGDKFYTDGIGKLKGKCIKISRDISKYTSENIFENGSEGAKLKIPHVGFNSVAYTKNSPIFKGIDDSSFFYFTHSYIVVPEDQGVVTGTTIHGNPFVSAIQYDNIYGVQFHPEKSSALGIKVLSNFVELAKKREHI